MNKFAGIIGYPLSHTVSPSMHNFIYQKLGIEVEYKKWEIEEQNLELHIEKINNDDFVGFSPISNHVWHRPGVSGSRTVQIPQYKPSIFVFYHGFKAQKPVAAPHEAPVNCQNPLDGLRICKNTQNPLNLKFWYKQI